MIRAPRSIALATVLALTGCASPDQPTPVVSSAGRSRATPSPALSTAPVPSTSPSAPAPQVTTAPPTPTKASGTPYVFPVSPASGASYGEVHHDYPATDVFAPCGSDVLATTSGVVEDISRVDEWDPASDDPAVRGGLSISFVGDDAVRYYGSHLSDVAPSLQPGVRVATGDVIGHVGETGNAAGTGCHLHFGISPDCGPGDWSVRRGAIYPWPFLNAWRDGVQTSPAAEIRAWLSGHLELCEHPKAS